MKDDIIEEDEELTDERIDKLFENWYRRPTYIITSGEYQIVQRNALLAVIRAFRKLRGNQ